MTKVVNFVKKIGFESIKKLCMSEIAPLKALTSLKFSTLKGSKSTLSILFLRYRAGIFFHMSFGFGQSFGQVSVSVSAETQNCGFGRSLRVPLTTHGKTETSTSNFSKSEGSYFRIFFINFRFLKVSINV